MKRRLFVLILVAIVGALLAAACNGHGLGHRITGSGHIITQEKDFSGFTVVDLENIFNTESHRTNK